APPVDATTVTGQPFDLSSWRGRWVVVNFFASWCPPCQQEEPELVSFAYEHRGPTDAALVGVVFDDAASSARAFLASSGASWPAVVDPGGQIALDFGVRGPPETFLVSPNGVVVVHLDGAVTAAGLDYWLRRAARGSA
ncbi:MAG: TlpA family protein disulfide reductase, partial [Acidimicrobiales bacterium]